MTQGSAAEHAERAGALRIFCRVLPVLPCRAREPDLAAPACGRHDAGAPDPPLRPRDAALGAHPRGDRGRYAFAWIGHFFFEKNRPATFKHPLYSLMGDWRLWFETLTGRIAF